MGPNIVWFHTSHLAYVHSVSALVMLLTEKEDGHLITFETVIKEQIKALRKQLDEVVPKCNVTQASAGVFPRSSTQEQDEGFFLKSWGGARIGGTRHERSANGRSSKEQI